MGTDLNTAKVTSKGQVTIPKEIRKRMAIEMGDRLAFELETDGRLRVSRIEDKARCGACSRSTPRTARSMTFRCARRFAAVRQRLARTVRRRSGTRSS